MDELTRIVIATAMRKMFSGGHFSICTVDECLKLAGIAAAPARPYGLLRALHCVSFGEMPKEIVTKLPELMSECFNGLRIDYLMRACEPGKLGGGVNKLLN